MSRGAMKLLILFLIVAGSAAGIMLVESPSRVVFGFLIGLFGVELLRELRS